MRWHAPTCHQPDIYVAEDGFPACRRCGKSAQELRHLREDQYSSLSSLPPDEPEGCLNLWWPSSMPYTSNSSSAGIGHGAKGSTDGLSPSGVKPDIPGASLAPPISPASHENGHIYKRPLTPNEFRLATLSALPDNSDTSYPIHLSFGVVEYDHYPDYDTVSYAWGGEDDNRDHNSLIYIGDHWDVLHATRNCWAVLRYLRPWRGTRLVWVDFICINQRDMSEKAQQISKMGQIYSNCNQVFLWLGEDAVSHDQAALPSRRPLKDLKGLHQILSRNYFTRVWVIQELVLSPRISMPCGNTVFEVHPQSLGNMEKELAESSAPWLSLATRGSSHNHSWAEVMRMTSQSKSSDARDGLYGVFGLWSSGGSLPLPSYAVSYQHMIIGMFAWRLIHEHDLNVLLAAKCISFADYEDNSPSWIPPWKKHNFWQWFIDVSSMDRVSSPTQPFGDTTMEYNPGILRPPCGRPWHQSQITVDHNTGGLSLVAIKIHEMQSDLQKNEGRSNELETATDPRDNVWSSVCGLYVQTCKDIEGMVKEGDEVYLLSPATSGERGKHEPSVYLFLRKVANQIHKLVLCVPMIYFRGRSVFESLEETRVDRSLAIDRLEEIWHRPMYNFDKDMHTGGFLGRGLQRTFPGNEDTPFHVLLAVILHNYDLQPLFDNDGARRLDAKIEADIRKDKRDGKAVPWLTFKFSKSDWEDVEALYTVDKKRLHNEGMQFNCNEYPFRSENWKSLYHWRCWDIPERISRRAVMYVNCELFDIHRLLRRIDRELCITSIWRSIGIRNPKGSWEELLHARAVYPSMTDSGNLTTFEKEKKHCGIGRVGNSAVVGLESRIHIV